MFVIHERITTHAYTDNIFSKCIDSFYVSPHTPYNNTTHNIEH